MHMNTYNMQEYAAVCSFKVVQVCHHVCVCYVVANLYESLVRPTINEQ